MTENSLSREERTATIERWQALFRADDLMGARAEAAQLVWDYPAQAIWRGLLADTELFLGRLESAIHHASIAVALAPKAELASLTLFCSFQKARRLEEALDEFLRIPVATGRQIEDCRFHNEMLPSILEYLEEHEELRELQGSFTACLEELKEREEADG